MSHSCSQQNEQQPVDQLLFIPPLLERQQQCSDQGSSVHEARLSTTLQYLPISQHMNSPQSFHHHNYTTVLSSILWQTHDYCTALLGISRHVSASHPSFNMCSTEHIKYHPPDSQPICKSPLLPQPYYPQSLMITLTQYNPHWPLHTTLTESPGT